MEGLQMSGHDDFAFEPVPGLPARLPKGEDILWQGRPALWPLAMRAYGIRWVIFYFALVMLWRAASGFAEAGVPGALAYGLPYVLPCLATCAVLFAMAWVQQRTTVYTITTARVVMRIGAALSVTFQIPFVQIGTARLDLKGDHGTIAIETLGETRISYLILWPHARPWHFARSQPALRCIPDAQAVATLLADAAQTRLAQPSITRDPAYAGDLVAAE
jgi:Bacterial PH domain